MTENNEKRLTMRQELRNTAEGQLDALIIEGTKALEKISLPLTIGSGELARMICGGQTKTHRHMLVTHLANRAEADLIALWNDQQKLDLGEKDADK